MSADKIRNSKNPEYKNKFPLRLFYCRYYHWIKKDIQDKNENIFDIVAGTSIGAINASIIVSHILERKEESNGKGIQ